MKIFSQSVFFSIILIFISSCEERIKESAQRIHFDVNMARNIKFSEFVDSVRIIKLETPKDVLISNISMIKSFGNYFVIRNSSNPPSLIIFDKNGKFISEIRSYGKGPGEYSRINSFLVNQEKEQIEFIDRLSQKKLTYSMENEFIEESITSKWAADCFANHKNKYFVYYGASKFVSDYMVGIYDHNYEKINSFLKIPENYISFFHIIDSYNFSKYKNETLFWHAFSS